MQCLEEFKDDVNVNSLIQAAALLDDEVDRANIRGLAEREFQNASARLVVNEVLGIALMEYISEANGSSENFRYVKEGLGLRKQLGPFLGDIIAALISRTMSRIDSYTLRWR